MRNARFWVHVNGGAVKITLRPGESRSWYLFGWHEEGWSKEAHTWAHEGEYVREQAIYDGRDCDGRFTSSIDTTCEFEVLKVRPPYPENDPALVDVLFPLWQEEGAGQRDYYAEAMGY